MNRLAAIISMAACGLLLCLADNAGVKGERRSAPGAEMGQGQQKAGQAPPKAFHCPQKEGTSATCPVSGRVLTIAKDTLSSELPGCSLYVYFCGEKCSAEFDRDPGGYVGDELANPPKLFDCPQTEGCPAACPVTGEVFTISKDTAHSEYRGKFVYFCCPPCQPVFERDPKKYSGEL
jgi:YHS domain-containing protein